ncbi:MAG: AIR synthase related protein, partial [Leptospirales bacterium]
YDTDIGNMRIVGPGQNAGVYRVPDTDQAVAAVTDCNSFYVSIDPYEGARHAIAESFRNLVASGAVPAGVTNCLNFANPYKPENYYFFERAVKGMSDASETLKLPITSGNVSFYNESAEGPVLPTPTIGMVGLLDDYRKAITGILYPDRDLYLVGHFRPSLEGSQYGLIEFEKNGVRLPELDLSKEVEAAQLIHEANSAGLVDAVVDLSMGGLIFALLKMLFAGKDKEDVLPGFTFSLSGELSSIQGDTLFWGESAHTYLIAVQKSNSENFEKSAEKNGVAISKLGSSNDSGILLLNEMEIDVTDIYTAWDSSLADVLH